MISKEGPKYRLQLPMILLNALLCDVAKVTWLQNVPQAHVHITDDDITLLGEAHWIKNKAEWLSRCLDQGSSSQRGEAEGAGAEAEGAGGETHFYQVNERASDFCVIQNLSCDGVNMRVSAGIMEG